MKKIKKFNLIILTVLSVFGSSHISIACENKQISKTYIVEERNKSNSLSLLAGIGIPTVIVCGGACYFILKHKNGKKIFIKKENIEQNLIENINNENIPTCSAEKEVKKIDNVNPKSDAESNILNNNSKIKTSYDENSDPSTFFDDSIKWCLMCETGTDKTITNIVNKFSEKVKSHFENNLKDSFKTCFRESDDYEDVPYWRNSKNLDRCIKKCKSLQWSKIEKESDNKNHKDSTDFIAFTDTNDNQENWIFYDIKNKNVVYFKKFKNNKKALAANAILK